LVCTKYHDRSVQAFLSHVNGRRRRHGAAGGDVAAEVGIELAKVPDLSETLEELVVYRQEYGERGLWVRPAVMFAETVEADGRIVPRFQRLNAE
jgi:hypothetical protein